VYVALATGRGETVVRRLTLPGNRDDVRRRSTLGALDVLWRYLEDRAVALQPAVHGSAPA
jgi:nicotinamide mononucleotide (NMN) deamidase PncC